MSLLYVDGFEWCANTTDLNYRYTVFQNQPWTQAAGRITGSSLNADNGLSSEITLNLNQNITSWVIGIGFRKPASCDGAIIGLRDAATNQVELRIKSDDTLNVTRNGSNVTGGTSVATLSNNVWYYIEWKVTIANSISANSCIVRVNETTVINVSTGQDLQNTSNNYAQAFFIGAWTTNNCRVDDLYVCNQSGSNNNDFLGDSKVLTLYADGNGTTNQWNVFGAGSNYQAVDEATPDGDTTYVYSTTPNDVDLYTYQNTTGYFVHGVQTRTIARKDNSDIRQIQPVYRVNGTNYTGNTFNLNGSYVSYYDVQNLNPDTAGPWTVSDLNDLEAGIKLLT